jgi:hypothetical protein
VETASEFSVVVAAEAAPGFVDEIEPLEFVEPLPEVAGVEPF